MTLAEKYRPHVLSDVIGQPRAIGSTGLITRMLGANNLRSCIFYGPPGCGKTTIARLIAETSSHPFVSLNATNAKLEDIRKALKPNETVLLYLDEIQYFNKKQQQSLLPYVESGEIILIAATTDNPYYCCYDALLSRCVTIKFDPVPQSEISAKLQQIANQEGRLINPDAANAIAGNCAGDVRRALNMLDVLFLQVPQTDTITLDDVKQNAPDTNMSGFDLDGDNHFHLISAMQKSIRGSDPNAAIFYLARLLEDGDLLSPCRRLLVIANEDIGFGNPWAVPFVYACVEMAKQVGLPEAKIPLSNAVVCLAISPKCSTAESTYNRATADIQAGKGGTVPKHLRHACSEGYLYPHDYPNHWVPQQYLPNDLVNAEPYYIPGDNDFERQCASWWSSIMTQQHNNTNNPNVN